MDDGSLCKCGWELPLSVFAFPNHLKEGDEVDENRIKDSHVLLMCPRCKRGHGFFDTAGIAALKVETNN